MKTDGTNAGTKLATAQKKPSNIGEWILQNKEKLETAIPRGTVNLERFMQSALLEIMNPKQPNLAKCDPMSIFRSLKESASLGLEVGGVLGQAYLIPYNETVNGKKVMTCHFQMGYKGLIALARRSNTIKTIACEVVYENDIFDVQYGVGRTIRHSRDFRQEKRGKAIAYYCLVELVNGGIQFDVETVEDIKEHRKKFAKSYRADDPNNIWNKNFDAMALKTCAIQALKLCPISIEALEAVRKDEITDAEPEIINVTPVVDFNPSDSLPEPFEKPKGLPQRQAQAETAKIPADNVAELTPEEEAEIDEAWENGLAAGAEAEVPDELF